MGMKATCKMFSPDRRGLGDAAYCSSLEPLQVDRMWAHDTHPEKDELLRVCELSIPIYVMEIDWKLFR